MISIVVEGKYIYSRTIINYNFEIIALVLVFSAVHF